MSKTSNHSSLNNLKTEQNPATKQWDIVINKNNECNYQFVIFLLREHFKKDEIETLDLIAELEEKGSIVVASHIAEVAFTIKSNMEIIAIKNEVNLYIDVVPAE